MKNKQIKTAVNIILFYVIVVMLSFPFNSGFFDKYYISFTEGTYFVYWSYLPACIGTLMAALFFYKLNKNILRKTSFLGNNPLKNIVFSIIPIIVFSIVGIENYFNENIYYFAFVYCITNFVYAIAEEICWRGYLNESLSSINKYLKYTITGILWWAWHLRFGNAFELFIFPIFCIMASFLMGALVDKTKSYLSAVGIHLFLMILTSNSQFNSKKLIASLFVIMGWIIIEFAWGKKEKSTNIYH